MVVIRIRMVFHIQFCAVDFTFMPVLIPAGCPAVVAACFRLDMAGISCTSALMLAVFDGRPCAPVVAEGGIFSDKGVACADFAACAGQVINRIVQAVRRGLQRIVIPNLLIVDMLMDRSPVRVPIRRSPCSTASVRCAAGWWRFTSPMCTSVRNTATTP